MIARITTVSATAIALTQAGVPSPGSMPMPGAGSGSWRISRAAVAAVRGGADQLLADGFHGRGVRRTEDAWRSHLARIADATAPPTRRRV